VDEVFEEFLTTADVRGNFTFLENVRFNLLEAGLARLDLRAEARIPRRVTLLQKVSQASVLANRRRNFQSARERVHAADVSVEQINRLKTLAPHYRVEVHTAGRQT